MAEGIPFAWVHMRWVTRAAPDWPRQAELGRWPSAFDISSGRARKSHIFDLRSPPALAAVEGESKLLLHLGPPFVRRVTLKG